MERVAAAPLRGVAERDLVLFAAATAAAWVHTVDELRIGQVVAVPAGIANVAAVAAWSRLGRGWRAVGSIAFGLWWALTSIPYHVVPLLAGDVTGQNLSGVTRVVAGVAMIGLGVALARRRDG